jgi:hypothetical protein
MTNLRQSIEGAQICREGASPLELLLSLSLSLSLSLHAVYMESNGTRDRTEGGEVGDQLIVIRSEAPARHTKNVAVQRTSTRHLDVSKRVWRFALRCRRTRVRHKIRFGSRQLDSVKFSHHSD